MASLLLLLALAVQDDPAGNDRRARNRALAMREECATALSSVDGVTSVGVGGSGTDYRILIAVRDSASQKQVHELIGDRYGGVRIVWSVARPSRTVPSPEAPPARPLPPLPEPSPDRANAWNASFLDCDIIRDYLRLKPESHPSGDGKFWTPCRVSRRTTVGPGGVTSFSYTDHRPDCPIRLGRVGEPPGADNFIAWVFRSGITPPMGGQFTLPSNDWAWGVQAAADMASRMPSIREGEYAAGPLWVGGYGWVYPYSAPVYPYYGSYGHPHYRYYVPYCHPVRYCWRPHVWHPLTAGHLWRIHR
jgi:hypothetical protein